MNLNALAKEIHENAKAHGFYEHAPSFLDRIALMHSELSEALEAFRDGSDPSTMTFSSEGKPEGIPSEFADVIIRILDCCAYQNIDIERAIEAKVAFNRSRPFKHGRARY